MTATDRKRFFSKTKRAIEVRPGMATPCLEWQASRARFGHGHFKLDGKITLAHRAAWEDKHGPIPDGICVLHKCDNPPCVDDEHLFLGTQVDNIADMDAKGRRNWNSGNEHHSRLHPECMARGERVSSAKLTKENVRFIFWLRAQGWDLRRLAAEFGVSLQLISMVLTRKIWRHIQPEVANG